jgi:type I restriction enzyme S subunit
MADDRKPKEQQGLPEGWKWVRLGEVIEEVKERNLSNDQLPLLTSSRKGIYLQDEYFNRIVASENLSNYKVIRKGQFTYRSMSDDETFVFNRLENIELGLVSPAYYIFQVIKGCSGSFLKYFINNSVEVKKQIYKYVEGTTRTALRFNQLKNFIVPLPPLPEQRKIAQILETVDNAIEKTEKIIEKYKRIKQGLMQDLLTKGIDEKGNIRSEKTHKFKDSPLGRIPEEWEVVRLGEVGEILIPLPPLSEQKRIAEILSQIDQTIEKEEKYKEKLERLKKGLMEDLLTGKVRVNKLLEGESHEMA